MKRVRNATSKDTMNFMNGFYNPLTDDKIPARTKFLIGIAIIALGVLLIYAIVNL
jgi:hypothetical protein